MRSIAAADISLEVIDVASARSFDPLPNFTRRMLELRVYDSASR